MRDRGRTIRLLEKTTFSYSSSVLPANEEATVPAVINVDVSWATRALLVMRVHSFDVGTGGTGAEPQFWTRCYNSAPTQEDPATPYRQLIMSGSAVTGVASFVPEVVVDQIGTAGTLAAFLDVDLVVRQWKLTAADLTIAVSVDLVLRA